MIISPLNAIVIVANVLGASMAVPQALKLLRTRSVEGISVTWAAFSVTVNAWWGIYGVGVGDLGIVPVSVISVLAYVAIGAGLVRFAAEPVGPAVRHASAATVAIGLVPVVALVTGGWTTAGIVLGALYGIQLSPAVVTVYRVADVSGVSLATWAIALAEAALWGAYGWAKHDVGLLTLAATGATMSTLVLARLVLRRPRRTYGTANESVLIPA